MKRYGLLAAATVVVMALAIPTAVSFAQDENTLIELIRSDVQAEKKNIIAEAMTLNEAQAAAFWPVYNKYATEIRKVYDERVAVLKDYAANVSTLTDEKATELIKRNLKAEGEATKLKEKYFKEFSKAVGPKLAAQFLQYESTLLRLIDLQLGIVGLEIPDLKKP
jgi:hypothetical protein